MVSPFLRFDLGTSERCDKWIKGWNVSNKVPWRFILKFDSPTVTNYFIWAYCSLLSFPQGNLSRERVVPWIGKLITGFKHKFSWSYVYNITFGAENEFAVDFGKKPAEYDSQKLSTQPFLFMIMMTGDQLRNYTKCLCNLCILFEFLSSIKIKKKHTDFPNHKSMYLFTTV